MDEIVKSTIGISEILLKNSKNINFNSKKPTNDDITHEIMTTDLMSTKNRFLMELFYYKTCNVVHLCIHCHTAGFFKDLKKLHGPENLASFCKIFRYIENEKKEGIF